MSTIKVIELLKTSRNVGWLQKYYVFIPEYMSNSYGDAVTILNPNGTFTPKIRRKPDPGTARNRGPRWAVMSLHIWMVDQYALGRSIFAMIPNGSVLTRWANNKLGMKPGDIIGVQLDDCSKFGLHDVQFRAMPLMRTGEQPILEWRENTPGIFESHSPHKTLQPLSEAQANAYFNNGIAVMPPLWAGVGGPTSPLAGPILPEEVEPDPPEEPQRDVMDLTKEFFRGC